MGLFDQFPYMNQHALNMDWILELIKKFSEELEKMKESVDDIVEQYPELFNQIYTLKNHINDVEAKFDALISEINLEISIIKETYATEEYVNKRISEWSEQLASNIAVLKMDIAILKSYVDAQTIEQKEYIDREINILENQIMQISIKPVQQVISPVTKKVGTVQTALDDLFNNQYEILTSVWGLTADEYDKLFLTAKEYDDHGLTADQYDYVGKWYLYPWHGWHVSWPMGLTADEYDDREFTAEQYDNFELTAEQYDTLARWYLGTYPFHCNVTTGEIVSNLVYPGYVPPTPDPGDDVATLTVRVGNLENSVGALQSEDTLINQHIGETNDNVSALDTRVTATEADISAFKNAGSYAVTGGNGLTADEYDTMGLTTF